MQTLKDEVDLPILNLQTYLRTNDFTVLTEWMLLHQLCLKTFGRKAGGLRTIMRDRRNPLWHQLKDLPPLMMQDSDLRFIDNHTIAYIKTCQQRAVAAYVIEIFLDKPS